MKTLLVLSIALVCALAHRSIEDLADMNAGVSQTNNGELLLNSKFPFCRVYTCFMWHYVLLFLCILLHCHRMHSNCSHNFLASYNDNMHNSYNRYEACKC